MPVPLDPVRLGAWCALLTAHRRLVDRLAAELRAAQDLPLTWYDVLINLAESADGRARMSELADRVLLSPSGLTRLVDRMSAAGLVDRLPCPGDRRSTLVALTAAGREALAAAAPVHLAGVAQHFGAHVDDAEARLLREVLERVTGALDETAGP